jgi:hypothetical protein
LLFTSAGAACAAGVVTGAVAAGSLGAASGVFGLSPGFVAWSALSRPLSIALSTFCSAFCSVLSFILFFNLFRNPWLKTAAGPTASLIQRPFSFTAFYLFRRTYYLSSCNHCLA